jgi:thiaminase/transcriptional activator TenA
MKFSGELRKSGHSIWEANYNHPFVQGIGQGTLAEDKFIFFLEQDYLYLIEYCRLLGLLAAKSPDLELMVKASQILQAILVFEMDLHRRVCADFGISAKRLKETRPAPYNLAYTSYLLKTVYQGDAADSMAALLPCLWGYNEIGLRLEEKGLPEHKHYQEWILTYSANEFTQLTNWCRDWIDSFALGQRADKLKQMEEIFLTTSRWEYLFWEMAWNKLDWPV